MINYKYQFFDDYSEGAHPDIITALTRTNLQQGLGYSEDAFSLDAVSAIQKKINNPHAAVYFVATGTQANLVCLASMLRSFESVIALDSGHINVFEAGAIEATGHKVHSIPAQDGKLTPDAVQATVDAMDFDQMVKPKVVYISQSTEIGSIYSKMELESLSAVCKRNQLYLYIDGARLGHAVMAQKSDVSLQNIAELADMFYIGGTKNGGLMGEAIVIPNINLQADFRRILRQRGALLAKARTVSLQFLEFFKDNLYFDNAKYANDMASKLAAGIANCGYSFVSPPITNQLFVIFPDAVIEKLKTLYGFHIWAKADKPHHTVVRLLTSWATPDAAVQTFVEDLKQMGA